MILMENTTTWESLRGDSLKLCMRFERDSYQNEKSLPKTNLFYKSRIMRPSINDEIIEIAKKHESLNERMEIYWKMMAYYIEWVIVDERMREYLDPNVRRKKYYEKESCQDYTDSPAKTIKKKSPAKTKKSKWKTKKKEISEEAITIYISNNNVLYDIVYKYIYSNIETWNISYLVKTNWEKKYIYSQMLEAEKIIKQVWLETFTTILAFIKQDDFRNKQILTIKKLNKKNSDGVPYYVVIMDKIKNYTPKVISIPTV